MDTNSQCCGSFGIGFSSFFQIAIGHAVPRITPQKYYELTKFLHPKKADFIFFSELASNNQMQALKYLHTSLASIVDHKNPKEEREVCIEILQLRVK